MGFASHAGVLLFLLVAGTVAADQIFTTPGVPFVQSSREMSYREISQESEPMTSHEGKRYTCFLPVEETKTMKSMLPQNATNVIIESEQRIAPKEPDELLEVLKDECFYRHEGWWSYEFCYHGKIRHVHVEGEKVIQEYVLGEYNENATASYHENIISESADDHYLKDTSKRCCTKISCGENDVKYLEALAHLNGCLVIISVGKKSKSLPSPMAIVQITL